MGDSNLELGVNFQGPGCPRLYNREPVSIGTLSGSKDISVSGCIVPLGLPTGEC
jgi:hypothetical protein